MKYFLFNKNIEESFEDFIQFYNSNQPQNFEKESEKIRIVLDSNGGKSAYGNLVIDMINQNPAGFDLIANKIFSVAFIIFKKARCKKYLLQDAIGAHHKSRFCNIDIFTNGKPVWDSDISQLSSKSIDADSISSDFMTKKEFKKYEAGDDVFFNFDRLKEIFPEAIII